MKTLREKIREEIGASPIPIKTPDLIAIVTAPSDPNARAKVWAVLGEMQARREVRRELRKEGYLTVAYWTKGEQW